MIDAVIWGLVQGLTEFLPVSSSGHLVLVPAFLSRMGWEVSEPELAVSAVLHLGTLLAVLIYYRGDIARLFSFRTDSDARRVLGLLALGTIPALVGLPLEGALDRFDEYPRAVAAALVLTAAVLWLGSRLPDGDRRLESGTWRDAVAVGLSQATALVPGISRSGLTITTGMGRRLNRREAARYSFLLAIPTIAGGGLLSLSDVTGSGVSWTEMAVGFTVAAVSGYSAIALLLRALARVGFAPFSIYCLVVGVLGFVIL